MISSWRRSRAARRAAKNKGSKGGDRASLELTIPGHFQCPISLDLMKDPVTLSTGITYDREGIERWIDAGNFTCPVTNQVLESLEPISNHSIRIMIQDWCVENRSYGVERIPTPRVPLTSSDVAKILSKIEDAVRSSNDEYCLRMVAMIKDLAKESERNKRCVASNGAGRVLAASFEALSKRDSFDRHLPLLEEILTVLNMTMSTDLDEETVSSLAKTQSLESIVWFSNFGSLSGRRSAVLAMKTLLSSSRKVADDLAMIDGVSSALVKLIKDPICPTTTKASLISMYQVITASDDSKRIIAPFLEAGLVDILVEILVDSERSITEKSLGVLDAICSHEEGLRKAKENALIMPLLVKKVLRVSDLATEFSTSIIWKLGKNDERVIREGVEVGAFQKLLLVLQLGCHESSKERVTELLKMMNVYRDSCECIDSLDFKNLKRPF